MHLQPSENALRPAQTAPRDQAQIKREEIVRRAAELFDEGGYHGTGLDDIARAVGIRKSTLYHYFRSKGDILFWIHEDVIDLINKRQLDRARLPMSPGQQLLELMADVLELQETRPGHARTFFEHFRELTPEQQAVVQAKRQAYQELLEEVLRRGIATGQFREVDVRLAALTILGACNWAYQWFQPGGAMRSRDIAYSMCDFLIAGLGTEASPPPPTKEPA